MGRNVRHLADFAHSRRGLVGAVVVLAMSVGTVTVEPAAAHPRLAVTQVAAEHTAVEHAAVRQLPEMTAVSCVSTTACVAVGGADTRTVAAVWNGTTWTSISSPAIKNSGSLAFNAVSCWARKGCLAVGSNGGAKDKPIVERWRGHKFEQIKPPNIGKSSATFDGVSCLSAKDCVAVGSAQGKAFAARWNGRTWRQVKTPRGTGGYTSVSCSDAKHCMAVGANVTTHETPAAAVLSARGFTSSHPVGSANDSEFRGVSCPTAKECVATGDELDSNHAHPQARLEVWNGKKWRVVSVKKLGRRFLASISCTSKTACVVVDGDDAITAYGAPDSFRTAGAQTNGLLEGVDCSGPNACMAVGDRFTDQGVIGDFEFWNGEFWTES